MKRLINIFFIAVLTAAFASCTVDGDSDFAEPIKLGEQAEGKHFSFSFGDPVTYASNTWTMEKRLYSATIFIETEGGGFYKFLSTEPQGSPLAFETIKFYTLRDEQTNLIVKYVSEATVKLPADVGCITNLAIIGNYEHRDFNIIDDLKAIRSWSELAAFQAPAPSRGVFLNLAHLAFKVFNELEIRELTENGNMNNVLLKRLAARVRPVLNVQAVVGNEAPYPISNWDALKQRDLFKFTTLIFYNPKGATYLLPELVSTADITAIPQYERFNPITFNGASLDYYVYEMTGDEPRPLVMYVIFEYRPNTSVEYVQGMANIAVERKEDGRCVLKHNHAYDVVFDIPIPIEPGTIAEWDNGWNLTGRP